MSVRWCPIALIVGSAAAGTEQGQKLSEPNSRLASATQVIREIKMFRTAGCQTCLRARRIASVSFRVRKPLSAWVVRAW